MRHAFHDRVGSCLTSPSVRRTGRCPAGPWPGVVVIHEAFGLNADIRGKADQMAAHGYVALAPDLYEHKAWIRCVRNAFTQLRAQSGPGVRDAGRGAVFPGRRADCTGRTGVIGFCMGGGFALLCATRDGFSVAAINYGEVPKDTEARWPGRARSWAASAPAISWGRRIPSGSSAR